MSILAQVSTAVIQPGCRIVIAGQEKVGKTTLACAAPGALLIPLEQGSAAIPVARTPALKTWEEIEALCLELINAAQAGKIARGTSLVWDSGTALERAIFDYTIRSSPEYKGKGGVTMATAHGAYGKAYDVALQLFERWTRYMDALAIHGGINIVITCHCFASRVVDPAHGEYDTWDLLLHSPKNNKTYGIREYMTQWADLIGFFHEPMFVIKAAEGDSLNQGMAKNEGRVLAVDRQPAWVAGNRYGLTGTLRIPAPAQGAIAVNSWNVLADAIYKATGNRIDIWNRS